MISDCAWRPVIWPSSTIDNHERIARLGNRVRDGYNYLRMSKYEDIWFIGRFMKINNPISWQYIFTSYVVAFLFKKSW
jgi:hypothetical protein